MYCIVCVCGHRLLETWTVNYIWRRISGGQFSPVFTAFDDIVSHVKIYRKACLSHLSIGRLKIGDKVPEFTCSELTIRRFRWSKQFCYTLYFSQDVLDEICSNIWGQIFHVEVSILTPSKGNTITCDYSGSKMWNKIFWKARFLPFLSMWPLIYIMRLSEIVNIRMQLKFVSINFWCQPRFSRPDCS